MAINSTRSSAIPIDTLRSLNRLEASMNKANNRLDGHDQSINEKLGKTKEDMLGVAAFVRGQLQAGGDAPLSITGLGGLAAQPQFAAVPQYRDLPALAKAEGALSVSNGQLYYFQGANSVSSTPQWIPLTATGEVIVSTHADRVNHVASTSDSFYYETDRTVLYLSDGVEWLYVCGTMLDLAANKPTDLGGNDTGFQFLGTDDHNLYMWDGAAWQTVTGTSGGASVVTETPAGVKNGVNKVFTLSFIPNTGSLLLFVNGIEQLSGLDYSIASSTITYTVAPKATDFMVSQYSH